MFGNCINKNVKFILSSIFTMAACLSLNAEEADALIYYGTADIVGKENIFKKTAAAKDDSFPQEQANPAKITSDESSVIYIAENAEIYGKELLFDKQTASSKPVKKASEIKKEAPATVEKEVAEQEPIEIVFPTFPFAPSSHSFSHGGSESAAIIMQQRIGGDEQAGKAFREDTCRNIRNADLPIYNPQQRQKLSCAATQCGILTSFSSQSPPALIGLSSRA